jgi:hypothetical protein
VKQFIARRAAKEHSSATTAKEIHMEALVVLFVLVGFVLFDIAALRWGETSLDTRWRL